jgi:DNA-binding transcriptional ArsR family regulator
MTDTENLRKKWARTGCRFAIEPISEDVDLEQLIIDTTQAVPFDPTLLWGMISWIINYADLINIHRLLRKSALADIPVLGVTCDIAMQNNADKKLHYILNKCTASNPHRILFNVMTETSVAQEHEKTDSLPVFTKWGLYCSTVTIKNDMLLNRERICKENPQLGIRALFGANVRADILFSLKKIKETHLCELARIIGMSYQPVYAEIENLARNNLVSIRLCGRNKMASLTPRMEKLLKIFPGGV